MGGWTWSVGTTAFLPTGSDAVLDVFLEVVGPCLEAGDSAIAQTIVGLGYWVPSYTGLLPFFFSVLITTHPVIVNVAIVMWVVFFTNQLLMCYTGHYLPGVSTTGGLTASGIAFFIDARRTEYTPALRLVLCVLLIGYNLISVGITVGPWPVLVSFTGGFLVAASLLSFTTAFIAPHYEAIENSWWYKWLSTHRVKERKKSPVRTEDLLLVLQQMVETKRGLLAARSVSFAPPIV